MAYFFNTPDEIRAMLQAIGAESIQELFEQIPSEMRLNRPLDIPPAMGELELTQHLRGLASKNMHAASQLCFLGAGSYDHFIPAVVDAIGSRSEFYTSYTPYQPEVSQGNLQAMFEYQTLICQLTGMDVSNSSLYDGGSAVAESVLMCLSATKRLGNVVVAGTVHPEYRQILQTYLYNLETQIRVVPHANGTVDPRHVISAIDSGTACVVLQQPNFFGRLEQVRDVAEAAHAQGAKSVVSVDPLSLGILALPGDLGVDVVVAEGQSLGSPMAYGGPYLGILACRDEFLRRMPGRLVGQTVDRHGRRCWVLTLQTREQHIRRDKATSNICTNQGLFALRASVYLALLGPVGLRELGELCVRKAHYAAESIAGNDRFELAFPGPGFKEFVVRDRENDVAGLMSHAREHGILAGVPLGTWFPELSDCFLVAVTEQRTKSHIDRWAAALSRAHVEEAIPA